MQDGAVSDLAQTGLSSSNFKSRRRVSARADSGQSLVIVVLAMFAVIAIAALAIDLAQWYQKHHQAQVSADASALAAANCLASEKCSSTTQNGDAYNTATTMASNNKVSATSVQFSTQSSNNGQVTVTTAGTAPQQFYLGQSHSVSATAVAAYTVHLTAPASVYASDCTNPTIPPATSSSGCAVNCATPGVTIKTAGNTNITGAIVTNGSLNFDLKGGTQVGDVEYGDPAGNNCSSNNSVKKDPNSSIANGPAEEQSFVSFPETFNSVWTSASSNECSDSSFYTAGGYTGSGSIAVTGSGTDPSKVVLGGNNNTIGSSSTPVIICANEIDFTGNNTTLTNVTLVANTLSFNGNSFTITPASTATSDQSVSPNVAIYDTGTAGVNFGSNTVNVTGVVYAPVAKITVSGNNAGSAFFEGNTVEDDGNNTAGGPNVVLTAFPGVDSLLQ